MASAPAMPATKVKTMGYSATAGLGEAVLVSDSTGPAGGASWTVGGEGQA